MQWVACCVPAGVTVLALLSKPVWVHFLPIGCHGMDSFNPSAHGLAVKRRLFQNHKEKTREFPTIACLLPLLILLAWRTETEAS